MKWQAKLCQALPRRRHGSRPRSHYSRRRHRHNQSIPALTAPGAAPHGPSRNGGNGRPDAQPQPHPHCGAHPATRRRPRGTTRHASTGTPPRRPSRHSPSTRARRRRPNRRHTRHREGRGCCHHVLLVREPGYPLLYCGGPLGLFAPPLGQPAPRRRSAPVLLTTARGMLSEARLLSVCRLAPPKERPLHVEMHLESARASVTVSFIRF